jgi:hypothetical protein
MQPTGPAFWLSEAAVSPAGPAADPGGSSRRNSMPILQVKATANGRKVRWAQLKEGQLVDAHGFSLAPTTVLTDVVADIIALGQSLDSQSRG